MKQLITVKGQNQSCMTQGGQPTAGRFSCGAAQLAAEENIKQRSQTIDCEHEKYTQRHINYVPIFSSQLIREQYHSLLAIRSTTLVLASIIRKIARHLPHDGLQHLTHS